MNVKQFKNDVELEDLLIAVLTAVNVGLNYKIGSVNSEAINLFVNSLKSLFQDV
jgi:hypothetical protein